MPSLPRRTLEAERRGRRNDGYRAPWQFVWFQTYSVLEGYLKPSIHLLAIFLKCQRLVALLLLPVFEDRISQVDMQHMQ